jgi:hypothetical protein
MIITVSPSDKAVLAKINGREARVVSVGPQVVDIT